MKTAVEVDSCEMDTVFSMHARVGWHGYLAVEPRLAVGDSRGPVCEQSDDPGADVPRYEDHSECRSQVGPELVDLMTLQPAYLFRNTNKIKKSKTIQRLYKLIFANREMNTVFRIHAGVLWQGYLVAGVRDAEQMHLEEGMWPSSGHYARLEGIKIAVEMQSREMDTVFRIHTGMRWQGYLVAEPRGTGRVHFEKGM